MNRREWRELTHWVRSEARAAALRTLNGRCIVYIAHERDTYVVLAVRAYELRHGQYRSLARSVDTTGAVRQPRPEWWAPTTGRLKIPRPALP
jgi:cytolysin (calcineurin-like family phosphatase)